MSENNNELLLGALLGGLLVGGTTLFLNSKAGRSFKYDATDKLQDWREQIEAVVDALQGKAQSVASDLNDQKDDYAERLTDLAADLKDQVGTVTSENKEMLIGILIGTVLGGALGAGGAALAANFNNKPDFASRFGAHATDLKRVVSGLAEAFGDRVEPVADRCRRAAAAYQKSNVGDILAIATTGLQLWQKFQKRR